MSRSHSIWIGLTGGPDGHMVAFTVRHEMETWLKTEQDPDRWRMFKLKDNPAPGSPVAEYDPRDLL